jgi:hypothetical protein
VKQVHATYSENCGRSGVCYIVDFVSSKDCDNRITGTKDGIIRRVTLVELGDVLQESDDTKNENKYTSQIQDSTSSAGVEPVRLAVSPRVRVVEIVIRICSSTVQGDAPLYRIS